jgi:uncharacterized SAM-binding protein YcdF (DUF218 family)
MMYRYLANASIRWTSCPSDPLAWIPFRELMLRVVVTPWLWLPLLALTVYIISCSFTTHLWSRIVLTLMALLLASGLYTPLATSMLGSFLSQQLPQQALTSAPQAVLLGRGSVITSATTAMAANLVRQGAINDIYVSGDERQTAERLVELGVPPARVAGDNCARTTWENAILTSVWLRQQDPPTPVPTITLITDRWQLPRATRAFQRQGVNVVPLAAPLALSPKEENRLALRETAAMLLYRLQGRA